MKNLILIFTLFVGLLSNAQSLTLSQTIEITPFTHNGIDYKHIKGSLNTDCDDFSGVNIGISNVLSLDGNEIIDLNANNRYTIADEPFRSHFTSFVNMDEIRIASNNEVYTGSDLLACSVSSGWVLGTDWYSNTDYPGYFYQPLGPITYFAYVPDGGTCEGNALCSGYSPPGAAGNGLGLLPLSTTPFFNDDNGDGSTLDEIETYFEDLIVRLGSNSHDVPTSSVSSTVVPERGYFIPEDFTPSHAAEGWIRGEWNGGMTNYVVTTTSTSSNTIEIDWFWTDASNVGHSGEKFITVDLPTRYYRDGVYYDDLDAVRAAFPNNWQLRLESGHFTLLYVQDQALIDAAQENAITWAISEINNIASSNN